MEIWLPRLCICYDGRLFPFIRMVVVADHSILVQIVSDMPQLSFFEVSHFIGQPVRYTERKSRCYAANIDFLLPPLAGIPRDAKFHPGPVCCNWNIIMRAHVNISG